MALPDCKERIKVEAVTNLVRRLYETAPFPEVMDSVVLVELAAATRELRAMFEDPGQLNWWEQPSQRPLREQFEDQLQNLEARVANYETIVAFRLGEIVEDPPTAAETWEAEYQGAVVGPVLYGTYDRQISVDDWQQVSFPDVGEPYRLMNQLCVWRFPLSVSPTMFIEASFGAWYEGILLLTEQDFMPEPIRQGARGALDELDDALDDLGDFLVGTGYVAAGVLVLLGGLLVYAQYRQYRKAAA